MATHSGEPLPLAMLSPAIIVGAALLLITLERRFPHTPGQALFRDGFWTDLLGYGLAQSYVAGLLIGAFIHTIDEQTGLSRAALVSDWPVVVQVAFFLVTHDLYIYWFHRLQHYSDVLWRTHEAHHSVEDVDWLAGTRSNLFEILINQTVEFAPIVLLGAAPEVAVIKGTLDAVWGMYIHSNVDVRSGRLQWLINGPEMHRWHHSTTIAPPGINFATKLAVWDWLFGTAYLPARGKPPGYGLEDENYPRRGFWAYLQQHAYALRPPRRSSES